MVMIAIYSKACLKLKLSLFTLLLLLFIAGCGDTSEDHLSESVAMFRGDMMRSGYYKSDETSAAMKVLWRKRAGEVVDSPAWADGIIYFADRDNTYAVEVANKQTLWSYKSKLDGMFSIALAKGLVITSDYGDVIALNNETGQREWTFKPDEALPSSGISEPLRKGISAPAVNNDSVFFTGTDGSAYSIDIISGSKNWQFKSGEETQGAVAISDSTLFFGSRWNFFAVDVATGNEKWRVPIQAGKMDSTPAVGEGLIYFNDGSGVLHALDCNSGIEVWNFPSGETMFLSSPAFADGIVYIGTLEDYYAIDGSTGAKWWNIHMENGGSFTSPVLTSKLVFFGSVDGILYAINRSTGEILSKMKIGDVVMSTPIVNDGILYLGNQDGLWAVSISDFS